MIIFSEKRAYFDVGVYLKFFDLILHFSIVDAYFHHARITNKCYLVLTQSANLTLQSS